VSYSHHKEKHQPKVLAAYYFTAFTKTAQLLEPFTGPSLKRSCVCRTGRADRLSIPYYFTRSASPSAIDQLSYSHHNFQISANSAFLFMSGQLGG
jgi:hypothetical protein